MSEDKRHRWDGPNADVPAHASPYPVSRLAPVHDLVDVAGEIQRADAMLATVTGARLTVIAEQIRALQRAAAEVLARAERDATLHHAKCLFEKRPGQTYHLYRRHDGIAYFSLMGPQEWSLPQPQTFVGSYRLEADMSWTPLDQIEERDAQDVELKRLLGR